MARCKAWADGLGDCDGCFIGRPEWCQAKGGVPKEKHEYVRQMLFQAFNKHDTPYARCDSGKWKDDWLAGEHLDAAIDEARGAT